MLIIQEKLEPLKIIVDCYYLILNDENKFYNWFNMENKDSLTPLDLAAQKGNMIIFRYLFEVISRTDESKLKLTEKRTSIFHNAAKTNQCSPIVFMYEKLQRIYPERKIFDTKNQFDLTPLHYACYHKSKNVFDLLLDLGADIDSVDNEGKSVLYYAANANDTKAVKKLLIRGANKELPDQDGRKPYDVARKKKNASLMEVLEKKNCLSRQCCLEIGPIKGIRHDFQLINFFLIYFFFVVAFISRFLQARKKEKTHFIIGNKIPYVEGVIFFLAIATVIINVLITSSFICCQKKKKKKEVEKNKKSLIRLFEESNNVCIKCRKTMGYDTVHCLVCDICVEKWDHHCFWLNTCIDKKTKKKFLFFFVDLCVSLVLNFCFGIFLIIFSYNSDNEEFLMEFFNVDTESAIVKNILRAASVLYTFFFSFPLIFNILPLCKELLSGKKGDEETTLTEFESKLISGDNKNDSYSY